MPCRHRRKKQSEKGHFFGRNLCCFITLWSKHWGSPQTEAGYQTIDSIEEGEYVLAYNETTGKIGYYPVTATWSHTDPMKVTLIIAGETIETTIEHPFYKKVAREGDDDEGGEWVPAGQLEIGDQLLRADDTTGRVEAIYFSYQPETMYNMSVQTAHTYFVGEGQWLVHNACNNALRLRPFASNSTLNKNFIEEMYRGKWVNGQWVSTDEYLGGLAGAVRRQFATGELVGGRDHMRKGWERIRQMRDILKYGKFDNQLLSEADLKIVQALYEDLLLALNGK